MAKPEGKPSMTLEEAIATLPMWVQIWINWMTVVIIGTMVALVFSKTTRLDALIILLTGILAALAMNWLYAQVGFVRLLGIVHILIWTPLAIYFWRRLQDPAVLTPYRQVIWVFLATICVSLLFDYTDVTRYALGERASMLPQG